MKAFVLAAALTAALLITPAKAYDEFVSQKLSEIKKEPGNKGLTFRKVTDAERKNLEEVANVPKRKGNMLLAKAEGISMVMIVRDDIVVSNSPPLPDQIMDQFLAGKLPAPRSAPKQPAPKGEQL